MVAFVLERGADQSRLLGNNCSLAGSSLTGTDVSDEVLERVCANLGEQAGKLAEIKFHLGELSLNKSKFQLI